MELVLPMYNVHPYFSLKILGKKVHIIHSKNTVLSLRALFLPTGNRFN